MATVKRPHVVHINSGSITASSSATDSITVGTNEEYEITEIRVQSATGAFTLEITDSSGYAFQNETFTMPAVGSAPNEFNIYTLSPPLILERGLKYSFKFTDTSAVANSVKLLLRGVRTLETP